MRFELDETQREIQASVQETLVARVSPQRLRQAAESRSIDVELWDEIRTLGWPGLIVAEEYHGAGLGLVELCVVLEEAGAMLAPAPLLETACAAIVIGRAGSDAQRERWLPALASGMAVGAIGMTTSSGVAFVAGPEDADVLVLLDQDEGFLVDGPGAIAATATIDPLRAYGEATAEGEPLLGSVQSAFAEATIAISAELTGVCRRALETTVAYVKQREQFNVPIGSFQAVAHRCAEMLLATESARATTYYAAAVADTGDGSLEEAASLAKVTTSAGAVEVTASSIQMHGGIGFTWEADLHWWYKRAQLSAQLLGSAAQHRERLASILVERSMARTE